MTAALNLDTWINKLSPSEKYELIEQIRDTIKPEEVPMPDWHKDSIDESIKQFEENPDCGIPLSEINEDIKNKYGF